MKIQLLLLTMILLPLVASAHDIEVKNANGVTIYYRYINNHKELAVTYRGNSYNTYSNEYQGNVDIPGEVTYKNEIYKVTNIWYGAFCDCSALTSVTIPNGVTSIEEKAFYRCSGLTSVTIPNSVMTIGNYVFKQCSALTSITIPNSVAVIGIYAFDECSALTSVIIPNGVTTIAGCAFSNCTSLTSVTIPNSVTTIESDAFEGCYSLTSITIPNSVTSIKSGAFSVCYGLTSIMVEEGNSKYDSRDNCNAIIETGTNQLLFGCQNTKIPNSVTSIGDFAFHGCIGLISVTIPNSVTSIGAWAFYNCSSLSSITIPNSVTSIGDKAFYSIDLSVVVSLIENPFTIGDIFSPKTFADATLYIPVGTKEKYQATNGWKDFKNIVEGNPTGIKIIENAKNKNSSIYDLNGVRLPEPKKGINIINGKKVVMK